MHLGPFLALPARNHVGDSRNERKARHTGKTSHETYIHVKSTSTPDRDDRSPLDVVIGSLRKTHDQVSGRCKGPSHSGPAGNRK